MRNTVKSKKNREQNPCCVIVRHSINSHQYRLMSGHLTEHESQYAAPEEARHIHGRRSAKDASELLDIVASGIHPNGSTSAVIPRAALNQVREIFRCTKEGRKSTLDQPVQLMAGQPKDRC